MRILADENLPGPLIEELRARGHDVASIAESVPGARDEVVLEPVVSQRRVILTLDKDFAALVVNERRRIAGIILVRMRTGGSAAFVRTVVNALESRDDWEGHVSVVDAVGVRMRALRQPRPRGKKAR